MCADSRRIGVLGGTFDPVHLGHLASAREIAAELALERVLLVLSARPPHKHGVAAAPADLRWQMLTLAVGDVEDGRAELPESRGCGAGDAARLEPCDVELRRGGPSWTVDTLRELARAHPSAELFLILGIDAYEEIDTWSRPGELLELANIVVTTRPGRPFPHDAPVPPVAARRHARYDPAIGAWVHSSGHIVRGLRIRGLDISATDIRRRVAEGLPVSHLTGPSVARLIHDQRLYRSEPNRGADDTRPPASDQEHPGSGKP